MQVKLHIELHGNRNEHLACLTMASMRGGRSNKQYDYVTVLFPHNTADPRALRSDNRRVLQAHTERHLRLIRQGGEQRDAEYSDGAYRIHPGRFGNATVGRIPRNVLTFSHSCADQRAYKAAARAAGLPAHGAPMPLSLASFLVEFLSSEDDLVVDPFGGSFTTAKAAERLGRRWLSTEIMLEYVVGAAARFSDANGFMRNIRMAA